MAAVASPARPPIVGDWCGRPLVFAPCGCVFCLRGCGFRAVVFVGSLPRRSAPVFAALLACAPPRRSALRASLVARSVRRWFAVAPGARLHSTALEYAHFHLLSFGPETTPCNPQGIAEHQADRTAPIDLFSNGDAALLRAPLRERFYGDSGVYATSSAVRRSRSSFFISVLQTNWYRGAFSRPALLIDFCDVQCTLLVVLLLFSLTCPQHRLVLKLRSVSEESRPRKANRSKIDKARLDSPSSHRLERASVSRSTSF